MIIALHDIGEVLARPALARLARSAGRPNTRPDLGSHEDMQPQRQCARRAMSSAGRSSQIRPHPPWTA